MLYLPTKNIYILLRKCKFTRKKLIKIYLLLQKNADLYTYVKKGRLGFFWPERCLPLISCLHFQLSYILNFCIHITLLFNAFYLIHSISQFSTVIIWPIGFLSLCSFNSQGGHPPPHILNQYLLDTLFNISYHFTTFYL